MMTNEIFLHSPAYRLDEVLYQAGIQSVYSISRFSHPFFSNPLKLPGYFFSARSFYTRPSDWLDEFSEKNRITILTCKTIWIRLLPNGTR